MKITELNGKQLKIVKEMIDEKYGRVWLAYYDYKKVWIVEGKMIEGKTEEEQEIIDDLDNKYGRPVRERDIVF